MYSVAFLWVLKKLPSIPVNTWGIFMVKHFFFFLLWECTAGVSGHVQTVSLRKDFPSQFLCAMCNRNQVVPTRHTQFNLGY